MEQPIIFHTQYTHSYVHVHFQLVHIFHLDYSQHDFSIGKFVQKCNFNGFVSIDFGIKQMRISDGATVSSAAHSKASFDASIEKSHYFFILLIDLSVLCGYLSRHCTDVSVFMCL